MPNRVQIQFIKDAIDQDYKLTDWEINFINSLVELPKEKALTDKQNQILNRIQKKLD